MARAALKPASDAEALDRLRGRIDQLNHELLARLKERAQLALKAGALKTRDGAEIYQPRREQEIIDSLLRDDPAPFRPEHVRAIFTEIISACRALEHELTVAFLGPEYTYTHLAAANRFGQSARLVSEPSPAEVFNAVARGRADLGVVAVENTTEGSVTSTLDLLIDTPLTIVGELMLPIRHALMSHGGQAAAVRRIVAHQQSLAQCRGYLSANFPGVEEEAVVSNSLAAKRAATDPELAAIASARAATYYGLRIIADNIQDVALNITRFLVLGREPVKRSGSDKTTVIFGIPEKVGALKEALMIFARNSVNLSMIQSRPQRGRPWEYLFFADLKGHREDPSMKRALAALARKALFLTVLGSYPEGKPASE